MIHITAIVHPGAELGAQSEIGPFCIVGEHVKIGARTRLLAHVVVNGHTTIGDDVTVHPFATIGTPSQDRKTIKGEKAYTTIGDRTIIREYVSVQRATGAEAATSVGTDCLLLAYVHIAHNCQVGNFVTMSNLAQLAGHVHIGDYATIGGATGVHQFSRIGSYAFVGGMTRLVRDAPPYFLVEGNPPKVYGLNTVGLRRAGFSEQELAELKRCYKVLYHSSKNISQAIEALQGTLETQPGRALLRFLETPSDRGIQR